MDGNILELRDVHYAYPLTPEVIRGVSLSVQKGAKIALVGPNGAGKTTLLLMCNGTLRPDAGEVRVNGTPIGYDKHSLREVRKMVGFVFQNSDAQVFAPTVYQDVAFGPLNLGIDEQKIQEIVRDTLREVGLSSGYERRPPHHLSGGERKRVAIAGILAMEPEMLIFDEPTSSLDPAGAEEIMDLLDLLNHQGRTILISTHDVELAFRWADEVIFMHNGSVLAQGPAVELFDDEDLLRITHLKPPMVVDLYHHLVRRGLLNSGQVPSGAIDLLNRIESRIGAQEETRAREICLCDVSTTNCEIIRDLVSNQEITSIGAMGSAAKHLAEQYGIKLDVTSRVIDWCILKAFAGELPLILTSGDMVKHTLQRIHAYNEESGIPVSVEVIGGEDPPAEP